MILNQTVTPLIHILPYVSVSSFFAPMTLNQEEKAKASQASEDEPSSGLASLCVPRHAAKPSRLARHAIELPLMIASTGRLAGKSWRVGMLKDLVKILFGSRICVLRTSTLACTVYVSSYQRPHDQRPSKEKVSRLDNLRPWCAGPCWRLPAHA